jgi:CRP/FNR family transcriptional regulator, dissimilatory nitrate respiration regulator
MSNTLHALFSGGSTKVFAKGETLFLTDAPVQSMFLVTQGHVDLVRHTFSGVRVLILQAGPGAILAEASAYSDIYHCDGISADLSSVRSISVPIFRARLDQDVALANSWAAHLAHGLQSARLNSAIRTMRTVGERLDAWLADGKPLPPKGQWQTLAQTLGVTREALYRELSKRR